MGGVQQITAWSYSRWQTYQDCPQKAKFKFIDKLPEPGSSAMERGSAIHKLAEDFTAGKVRARGVPPELVKFKEEFKELKRLKPLCEEQWAFTSNWQTTGWFDKDAWLRVKMDAYYLENFKMGLIDHKTGKVKEDHITQLGLYALAGFKKFPEIETAVASLWYLDHGTMTSREYTREQMAALQKEWERMSKPMLNDTKFLPKPGNSCRWCHFSKSKQGPCRY